jgi:hypothetical protein
MHILIGISFDYDFDYNSYILYYKYKGLSTTINGLNSMLEKLFGSKTRVKILKLFFLRPEGRFYMRQMARNLKLQINSVRRELENLEGMNILVAENERSRNVKNIDSGSAAKAAATGARSAKKGGWAARKQDKKFFRINQEFVLHEELRALVVKAQILYERDFIRKLETAGQIKLLIFTGRFVNNQASAVDLLIVGRLHKPRLYKFIKGLENELGQEINFTFMSDKEFRYRRDITDIFLYDVLEGKKIVAVDEYGIC